MPRPIAKDDDKPRRRRGAVAAEAQAERGLAMRILLHSPKDTVAGALAFAAVSAIIANALFLQTGSHPSPMFGSVVVMPAAGLVNPSPLPRPRPVEATIKSAEAPAAEPKLAEPKLAEPKLAEPKSADPLGNLVKATSALPAAPSSVPRPPAPIPVSSRPETIVSSGSRRVAAVQRALTEYGYGQLKPTGTVGSDTQAAIQKFEREHKVPVTGQVSDRLVRELTAMIGHPID
ncbi:peptidoglycan-binding domain-containing protein [Bradyrhizobium erythrophlei]|uniref:Putative peptidoglycan binding domain-containing protein n=1 Tax=Bradyrhizobium erythrophlei TaxID=1437360 RepID=A0A1M5MM21_9BRAD|nr:peptidoglycan-binding domain-containing protein [Bradyrhizobium erythrophlei]SHG78092.1 Putative peptidoglycan binding domain-containing protein [Bradyrhizobium erythrophlei]